MLGNQESQGEPQDKLSCQLEPDQEVAAVLGTGIKWKGSDSSHVFADLHNICNLWIHIAITCCSNVLQTHDLNVWKIKPQLVEVKGYLKTECIIMHMHGIEP